MGEAHPGRGTKTEQVGTSRTDEKLTAVQAAPGPMGHPAGRLGGPGSRGQEPRISGWGQRRQAAGLQSQKNTGSTPLFATPGFSGLPCPRVCTLPPNPGSAHWPGPRFLHLHPTIAYLTPISNSSPSSHRPRWAGWPSVLWGLHGFMVWAWLPSVQGDCQGDPEVFG